MNYLYLTIPLVNWQAYSDTGEMDLVTIAFDNPMTVEVQTKLLRKFLRDSFVYTVADNSTDKATRKQIYQLCRNLGVNYLALPPQFGVANPSLSHGLAMNWVYQKYLRWRNRKLFGFIDHDVFPLKETNISKEMNKTDIWGLPQKRGRRWYLWAGFCFFRREVFSRQFPNFLPAEGLDTGGGNWENIYQKRKFNFELEQKHSYRRITRQGHMVPLSGGAKEITLLNQGTLAEVFGDWCHIFGFSWRKKSSNYYKHRFLTQMIGKC